MIAGVVAAGVVVAVIATLAGGGSAATIAKRLTMPRDASVLTANQKTALVSGAGTTLTQIDLDDGKSSFPVHGLGTIDFPPGAPQGRSIALTDTEIVVDSGPEDVVHFAQDRPIADSLRVPRSTNHVLAASSDALWVLSPDASELARLPNGSTEPPDTARSSIPAGSATQLAVTDRRAYVLFSKGDPAHQRILTVKRDLTAGAPPALGLTGSAIRTGDNLLMVLHGDTLELDSTLGGPLHSIKVGAGARGFDFNAGRLWVTYTDGTLKRFSSKGEAAGDPLELGGQPLAIDARDDRAWVLVETGDGEKQLLDVRP
jgi:hypothetical protein